MRSDPFQVYSINADDLSDGDRMSRKGLQVSIILSIIPTGACGTARINGPVERQAVIDLVCGPENQADCIASVCGDEAGCPLFSALTNQAVFDFVKTYSECEGCNTPQFPPDLGIGKCIEYQVSEISSGWRVTFLGF